MKILIVNKFLYPNGGSETYIFEIGRCLRKMGHTVEYFGMEHEGRIVGNSAEIYTDDIEFHEGGAGRGGMAGRVRRVFTKLGYPFKILYSREAYRKMQQLLDVYKPDVVHLNNINFQLTPSVIEAVADYDIRNLTETRIVYTAHDSQWVCPGHLLRVPSTGRRCFDCEGGKYINCMRNKCIHGSTLRSALGAIEGYKYRRRGTYAMVDTVICPSEFMKRTLETAPDLKGRCAVLRNFVNVNPTNITKSKYAVYFGRYSEEKGITTLLEACKRLPDVRFIFAGSGPLQDDVEAASNVTNVGFKSGDELHDLIAGAAFSIFPSECHENCSFSVMESISYGTPIIASATGGTPELVSDGVNGILYEAGDVDALTGHIRSLWDDPVRVEALTSGCLQTHFPTPAEYCEELVKIYCQGN